VLRGRRRRLRVYGGTTRNLIWVVAHAIQRHQLVRENQRLTCGEQTRRQREHDEAAGVLEQQRALLSDPDEPPPMLPRSLSPITANCCGRT